MNSKETIETVIAEINSKMGKKMAKLFCILILGSILYIYSGNIVAQNIQNSKFVIFNIGADIRTNIN